MFGQLSDNEYLEEVNNMLQKHIGRMDHNFKKMFEDHFGRSFSFIKQRYKFVARRTIYSAHESIRVKYAMESLKHNYCMVVMKELGFDYESNFARWFRKHRGINPSEYKTLNP